MKKYNKLVAVLTVSAVAILGITGCQKSSGGGWIPLDNGKKATFGFQTNCKNVAYPIGNPEEGLFVAHITGQFQFKDHADKLSIHGVVDYIPYEGVILGGAGGLSCEALKSFSDAFQPNVSSHTGTYTPQPKNAGEGGSMSIIASDGVCGDDGTGDRIQVSLTGGLYDGYTAGGCLEGGNITVF